MALILQSFKWDRRWQTLRKCDIILRRTIKKQSVNPPKLAEVGRLLEPRDGKYETGQLFLHRIFGYRGVILFPWTARVYDRDLQNPNKQQTTPPQRNREAVIRTKSTTTVTPASATTAKSTVQDSAWNVTTSEENIATTDPASTPGKAETNESKEVKGRAQTFYQVLIDTRDCPHIRAQTEAVTFLGNQDSNRSLYAIPGLDYVAHDDIMPYFSGDKHPLQHELFDKFLTYSPDDDPPFVSQDTLRAWQEKNQPWLDMSDVHKETTENVRITVIPFYMGCRDTPASSVYWWRYCIRLENLGELSVQLRERHWRIFSLSGTLETVRGRGVVGQEPILSPRLPAFQYSSHVSLQAPSGHMWGTFRLEREDGYSFDCKIPPFSLESKPEDSNPTSLTPTTTTPPTSHATGGGGGDKKDNDTN